MRALLCPTLRVIPRQIVLPYSQRRLDLCRHRLVSRCTAICRLWLCLRELHTLGYILPPPVSSHYYTALSAQAADLVVVDVNHFEVHLGSGCRSLHCFWGLVVVFNGGLLDKKRVRWGLSSPAGAKLCPVWLWGVISVVMSMESACLGHLCGLGAPIVWHWGFELHLSLCYGVDLAMWALLIHRESLRFTQFQRRLLNKTWLWKVPSLRFSEVPELAHRSLRHQLGMVQNALYYIPRHLRATRQLHLLFAILFLESLLIASNHFCSLPVYLLLLISFLILQLSLNHIHDYPDQLMRRQSTVIVFIDVGLILSCLLAIYSFPDLLFWHSIGVILFLLWFLCYFGQVFLW